MQPKKSLNSTIALALSALFGQVLSDGHTPIAHGIGLDHEIDWTIQNPAGYHKRAWRTKAQRKRIAAKAQHQQRHPGVRHA